MITSDSTENIFAALVAAKKAFKPLVKNNFNPHFKNSFADLTAINDATQDALLKHGLTVVQFLATAEGGIAIGSRLIHSSGEWIEIPPAYIPATKPDAQGYGSAATYGRRYQIAALLGLAAEDDDDGNGASKPVKESAATVAKRLKQTGAKDDFL